MFAQCSDLCIVYWLAFSFAIEVVLLMPRGELGVTKRCWGVGCDVPGAYGVDDVGHPGGRNPCRFISPSIPVPIGALFYSILLTLGGRKG